MNLDDLTGRLYLPPRGEPLTHEALTRYLANLELELDAGVFAPSEVEALKEALFYNYLDPRRREFFLYHLVPYWLAAASALVTGREAPVILELGCGTGTSALLWAALGARVVAVDLDPVLVGLARKRQELYARAGRELAVEFLAGDVFAAPFAGKGPFTGVFSLFAFNLMQPTLGLLDILDPQVAPGGRFFIADGNKLSLYRILGPKGLRSSKLAPRRLAAALARRGYDIIDLETRCALPPLVFRQPAWARAGLGLESWLRRAGLHPWLGVSYELLVQKRQTL